VTHRASDGYFILNGVPPGEYLMRVSRQQLQRLGLNGTVLNGRDLYVERGEAGARRPAGRAALASVDAR
jgi:hypothetical protein